MFARIVGFSLANRLLVLVLALGLVIWGLLAVRQLPVDVLPDLNRTTVTVMSEAPGLAAGEVEALVTVPLESALGGLPDTIRMRSSSVAGLSIVYVDFNFGAKVLENRQKVAERLAALEASLPPGVTPTLAPVASIMGEVMLVAVTGKRHDALGLRELADFTLRPKLLAVPGVAQVIPIGGGQRQYVIAPRLEDMAALGATLDDIRQATTGFSMNAGGGFLEADGRELPVRVVTRSTDPAVLAAIPVETADGRILRLDQLADVSFGTRPRRGDAGFRGEPAVILSISKQPGADTISLTRAIEAALADAQRTMPAGVRVDQVQFRQSDFVETSISNVQQVLLEALVVVGVVLFAFLLNVRTTAISLVAIPLSVLATAVVFSLFDISINTMTLGGIAIAVGELVDDAVVDVENIFRRLKENAASAIPRPLLEVVAAASQEVRSGIVYATFIIILVFLPLFALGGLEGQLFRPLGIAYVTAILASLLVAITVTPVLASFLLGSTKSLETRESPLVAWLKRHYSRLLAFAFGHERLVLGTALALFLIGVAGAYALPRTFLPPFNEGSFTVNLLFQPGISLTESARLGATAERLLAGLPDVESVGRRTGRGELDEHAEGVHFAEIDIRLRPEAEGRKAEIASRIREVLAPLPGAVNVGQPIGHRLDHLVSGVRAEIAVKLYGEDLDTLRSLAGQLEAGMRTVPGLADVQVERTVRVPQLDIQVRPDTAAAYGIAPAEVARAVSALSGGETVGEVIDGLRRFDVVIRLAEPARTAEALALALVDTPAGPVPLGTLADIVEVQAPNQYIRENGRRRLALLANTDGTAAMQDIVADIEAQAARLELPPGASVVIEGTFEAQRSAARTIGLLGLVSLLLIFALLASRYRSPALALIVMGAIPLALVGSVVALMIAGEPLSVASMVGFVTLAGIAARNGILKISHWLNLMLLDGLPFDEETLKRGALDRLSPVLMTALSAALALVPLLIGADAPGKEILHPVAVTIFGGLITSTLLDAVVTPLLFRRYGPAALARLRAEPHLSTLNPATDHPGY
ncbi:MAG: efflux RND transporter permease subunit [Sandarakinorhabdus sp.]|nr:efflux RND transporter permease subunit [Sandarakinorhabdus sp.]